jgi:cell division septum initiation protein DivIVA
MNLTNERKLELTVDALLNKCEGLEKSIESLRGETAQAWATAKKWKEEEEAKSGDTREQLEELCTSIEEIGGLIQLVGGGNMLRHPCDAILYQVKQILTPICAQNTQCVTTTEK